MHRRKGGGRMDNPPPPAPTQPVPTSRNASQETVEGDSQMPIPDGGSSSHSIVCPRVVSPTAGLRAAIPVVVQLCVPGSAAQVAKYSAFPCTVTFDMAPASPPPTNGGARSSEFVARFRIGRGPAGLKCEVACHLGCVSREHCTVEVRYRLEQTVGDGGSACGHARLLTYSIVDTGSLNGVILNGLRLYPRHAFHLKRWTVAPLEAECAIPQQPASPKRGRGSAKKVGTNRCAAPQFSLQIPVDDGLTMDIRFAFPGAVAEGECATGSLMPAVEAGAAPATPTSSIGVQTATVATSRDGAPGDAPPSVVDADGAAASGRARGSKAAAKAARAAANESGALSPRRIVSRIINTGLSSSTAKNRASEAAAGAGAGSGVPVPASAAAVDKIAAAGSGYSPSGLVVVTTGFRLTDDEVRATKRLGVTVNPPFEHFSRARFLVAEPPLQRSVKLLCALPHVDAVVNRAWLARVLSSGSYTEPAEVDMYTETCTRGSIEGANDFVLRDTLTNFSPAQRQKLFGGRKFWVHHKCVPQEPPANDLKAVIDHSGGVITPEGAFADYIVVPSRNGHAVTVQRTIAKYTAEPGVTVICPEDIFVAVLRQSKLCSTVDVGNGGAGAERQAEAEAAPAIGVDGPDPEKVAGIDGLPAKRKRK